MKHFYFFFCIFYCFFSSYSYEYIIPDGTKIIPSGFIYSDTEITSVIIPDSVVSIGSEAFYKCPNLTKVTIGKGLESIYEDSFKGSPVKTLILNASNLRESPRSVSYHGNVVWSPFMDALEEVFIGSDVTQVPNAFFSCCEKLVSVFMSEGVTAIGSEAFWGCTSLTSVMIPSSVRIIDYKAFCNCSALASINIPDGISVIGERAFFGCDRLASIVFPSSIRVIEEYAFGSCRGLKTLTFPPKVSFIGENAFDGCSGLKTLCFENPCVKNYAPNAFGDCYNIDDVFFPNGLPETTLSFGKSTPIIHGNAYAGNTWNGYNLVEGEDAELVETIKRILAMDKGLRGIDLVTGWNLVALPPTELSEETKETIRSASKIYAYDRETKSFVKDKTLSPSKSYWIYADREFSIRFTYIIGRD